MLFRSALASPVSTLMAQNVPYAGASQVGAAQMGGALSQFGSNLSNLGIQQMKFRQLKDLFGKKEGTTAYIGIGGDTGVSDPGNPFTSGFPSAQQLPASTYYDYVMG